MDILLMFISFVNRQPK